MGGRKPDGGGGPMPGRIIIGPIPGRIIGGPPPTNGAGGIGGGAADGGTAARSFTLAFLYLGIRLRNSSYIDKCGEKHIKRTPRTHTHMYPNRLTMDKSSSGCTNLQPAPTGGTLVAVLAGASGRGGPGGGASEFW